MSLKHPPIIAVDGGGTSCDAGLFVAGECIDRVKTGPANAFVDSALAQKNIVAAVSDLASMHDLAISEMLVSVGCAGMGIQSAREAMQTWQNPFKECVLTTDINIAAIGANHGDDCHMLIVGTGSCGLTLTSGEILQTGGHGCLLGDDASGAWLGQEALRYCLLAFDGLVERTPLVNAVLEKIACENASELIARYHHLNSAEFASLAPLLFAHAGEDDMAGHIVAQGIEYLVHLKSHLLAQQALPIFAYGSVWQAYADCMIDDLMDIRTAQADPLHGAFLYGLARFEALQ